MRRSEEVARGPTEPSHRPGGEPKTPTEEHSRAEPVMGAEGSTEQLAAGEQSLSCLDGFDGSGQKYRIGTVGGDLP